MNYVTREKEGEVINWIDEREIIAIRGPRQSGKTTLLKRMIDLLLARGVSKNRIQYVNFEEDIIRLQFEADCKEFVSSCLNEEKTYFFFDEVQYVKDIGKKLKLIFDTFSNIKITVTGSSSFELMNLGKYLVGRVVFFNLYPFSFIEFLRAKGEKYEKIYRKIKINFNKIQVGKTIFLDELNKLLREYLTFGSYPRIVLESNPIKKQELLKNLFITYVEKDVVSVYGSKYRDKVVKLSKALSVMLGGIIKYETLSETSGLKYHEVREIMPLLQDFFVISIVPPFYKNLLNELRKNPKVYFVDYGLRNYLYGNFNNLVFDGLYENFVYNELSGKFKVKYWRTTSKTEIDFVLENNKIIPVEVKTSPRITRALRSFIGTYKPGSALIVNAKETGKEKINNCNVFIVPFVYL